MVHGAARNYDAAWEPGVRGGKEEAVPLSDHEQRILAELEESLNREDPEFADKVRNETLYRHSGRQARWAAFGFVLGLILTVWLFVTSLWLALVGVAIMFASAI